MKNRLLRAIVFLFLFQIHYWFLPSTVSAQFLFLENSNVSRPALDFTLPNLQGEKIVFSEFRGDKRAIIIFWATWCPHCRKALVALEREKKEIESNGVKVLLVDMGEKHKVVDGFVKKKGITFEILLDEKSSLTSKYDITGIPAVFFINTDGIVTGAKHSFPKNYLDLLNKKFKM